MVTRCLKCRIPAPPCIAADHVKERYIDLVSDHPEFHLGNRAGWMLIANLVVELDQIATPEAAKAAVFT
jgi:hypothetical protein